jgi:hypothetical protein
MKARHSLLLFLSMLVVPAAMADWVLVANPKSGVEHLSRDEVVNIYLGRYRLLSSGISAEPVDLVGEHEGKTNFYRRLVDKSLAEINAYWARLVFSGKTQPPRQANSTDEALQFVVSHPGGLAYVERGKVDRRVSVVFDIPN